MENEQPKRPLRIRRDAEGLYLLIVLRDNGDEVCLLTGRHAMELVPIHDFVPPKRVKYSGMLPTIKKIPMGISVNSEAPIPEEWQRAEDDFSL